MKQNEVLEFIDSQFDHAIDLWNQIVRIETPSNQKEQVNYLASHLDTYLNAMGLTTQKIHFENAGDSLVACSQEKKKKPIAFMGHIDTVHPIGAFKDRMMVQEGDMLYGPGVYDCKGGVVIAILAIKTLLHFGYDERQLKLILSGDEEVAHSFSKQKGIQVYKDFAKDCAYAFNCESAMMNGDVVTKRKGGGIVTIKVHGVSAHAGRNPEKGASAIREACRIISKLEELSDPNVVLYNCGKIQGGTSANVIPDQCEFSIGLRFSENIEYEKAISIMKDLCSNPYDSRIHSELQIDALFEAMEKVDGTDLLFDKYVMSCKELGYPIPQQIASGGCSDAAYVTSIGIPTLCGVGVRGKDNHALTECADVNSLLEQTKKLVLTVFALDEKRLES